VEETRHTEREGWLMVRRVWVLGLAASQLIAAVVISGRVILPSGHGVPASLTIHDLSTPRIAGNKAFDRQFASKRDGAFSLSGVPAGKFRICVDAPQENVLDPCLWSTDEQTFTVTDGVPLTNLNITVQVGTKIRVHVNDPQDALPKEKGGVRGDALTMVVQTSDRRYHNLRQVSSGPSGSDHYLVVPFDQTVTLVTESTTVALKDQDGKRVSGDSKKTPIRVSAGKSAAPVVVNVEKK
jgi:hypothetical protein